MKTLDDIYKLPKWAQKMIKDRDQALYELENKVDNLQKANQICNEMDWFTLGFDTKESRRLYILNKDQPTHVCTIGEGAVLLVGHKRGNK